MEYQKLSIDPTEKNDVVTALTVPAKKLEVTFSGLQPFTQYKVRYVVINKSLLEGYSEWVTVTTLAAPPSELGTVSAVQISDGRALLLSWKEPSMPNGKVGKTY